MIVDRSVMLGILIGMSLFASLNSMDAPCSCHGEKEGKISEMKGAMVSSDCMVAMTCRGDNCPMKDMHTTCMGCRRTRCPGNFVMMDKRKSGWGVALPTDKKKSTYFDSVMGDLSVSFNLGLIWRNFIISGATSVNEFDVDPNDFSERKKRSTVMDTYKEYDIYNVNAHYAPLQQLNLMVYTVGLDPAVGLSCGVSIDGMEWSLSIDFDWISSKGSDYRQARDLITAEESIMGWNYDVVKPRVMDEATTMAAEDESAIPAMNTDAFVLTRAHRRGFAPNRVINNFARESVMQVRRHPQVAREQEEKPTPASDANNDQMINFICNYDADQAAPGIIYFDKYLNGMDLDFYDLTILFHRSFCVSNMGWLTPHMDITAAWSYLERCEVYAGGKMVTNDIMVRTGAMDAGMSSSVGICTADFIETNTSDAGTPMYYTSEIQITPKDNTRDIVYWEETRFVGAGVGFGMDLSGGSRGCVGLYMKNALSLLVGEHKLSTYNSVIDIAKELESEPSLDEVKKMASSGCLREAKSDLFGVSPYLKISGGLSFTMDSSYLRIGGEIIHLWRHFYRLPLVWDNSISSNKYSVKVDRDHSFGSIGLMVEGGISI